MKLAYQFVNISKNTVCKYFKISIVKFGRFILFLRAYNFHYKIKSNFTLIFVIYIDFKNINSNPNIYTIQKISDIMIDICLKLMYIIKIYQQCK